MTGYVAVRPLPGWSDHVGEVRLVVSPASPRLTGWAGSSPGGRWWRRSDSGLSKLVVEVVAEQGAALALFTDSGSPARRCSDHIRDRSGQLRDLMVLAHHVGRRGRGWTPWAIEDELSAR